MTAIPLPCTAVPLHPPPQCISSSPTAGWSLGRAGPKLMHFSQEILHRSLAGHLVVQAATSPLPRVADLAKHHSISWQWNGMGPVFSPSLVTVSGSGDSDRGKQLLTGPQRHLPKAREGNVATVMVKKVWAAKPEHPHLVLKPWNCSATCSLVERSRGEMGKALERLARYFSPGASKHRLPDAGLSSLQDHWDSRRSFTSFLLIMPLVTLSCLQESPL